MLRITKSSFRSASQQFLPAEGGSRQSEAGVQPARGFSPASEDATLRSRVCGAEAPRGLKSALQSRRIAVWFAAKPRCGALPLLAAFALCAAAKPATVVLRVDSPRAAPAWAVLERHLIETLNRAGKQFVATYSLPDGSLRWKERYEGGMNSSDDAYEAFRALSLLYVLGGSKELDRLHRWVWEGITRQFTRYGNIYREFDSNWDWMHHGEGYTSFYTFGLADPDDEKFRRRAERFAAMYIGEDPEAPNYEPEHNILRAVMNGSRGPKMEWTVRDWIPTNANLAYYHLPFDDIPGVKTPTGWINDGQFAVIVRTMSERMARGDVPINLTIAPLIANAYLYTGEGKYKEWILRYIDGWVRRTEQNGGITPDNVGLTGKIGEYLNGNWWGGYYGWKWPRGGIDIVRAQITAAKAALLLTGDFRWFDLPRSQLEVMRRQGRIEKGVYLTPARYDQRGWHHYTPEPSYPYVWIWALSQDERDWKHIERLAANPGDADVQWAMFLKGRNPGYPEQALRDDLRFIRSRLNLVLHEHGDPDTWFDAHWASRTPLRTDALERLTLGAVPIDLRGEMLHAWMRYFCAETGRPGLPEGVAALVTRLEQDRVTVELVNTDLFARRRVIIQGGAYGEHQILAVTVEQPLPVNRAFFEVDLGPGSGATLAIEMRRYANTPRYAFP
jgi:hypothetical protein